MFVRATSCAGLLLLSTACVDYKFEQKCPEGITESEITVPAVEPSPADILFVVDNSGSMADEQQNLADNFNFFINQIAGSGDYQIAIVTTDLMSSEGELTGFVDVQHDTASAYRELLSIDDDACVPAGIEHGCFRGPDPANRVIRVSKDDPPEEKDRQIATFVSNVSVGSCGTGTEQGLLAMLAALEKTGPGECNEGFLRDDANLVVVFVSDEEDADNTQISQHVQDLARIKDLDKVRVAAIVGAVDGDASACSINEGGACGTLCQTPPAAGSGMSCTNNNQCPSGEYCGSGRCENKQLQYWTPENCGWCTYFDVADCCSALAGTRYVRFAQAIESRIVANEPTYAEWDCKAPEDQNAVCLVDSICQSSFGATLERIAKDLVITSTYRLEPAPTNPAGIKVRVFGGRFGEEGVTLSYPDDYTVVVSGDGAFATLTITAGENTPSQEGEQLDVNYVTNIERPTERRGACPLETGTSSAAQ